MGDTAGYGTGIEYGSALLTGSPSYTELTEVISVTPPQVTIDESEKKHLKSPNQAVQKRPSWKRAGDVTVKKYYDAAEHAALLTLAGTKRAWRVTLADGSTYVFDGFIKAVGNPDINGDGDVETDVTIAADLPTFTEAT